jgi:hypothetical protein
MKTTYRLAFSSYYEAWVLIKRVLGQGRVRLKILAAKDRHGDWVKLWKDHTAQHPQLLTEIKEVPESEVVAALLSSNLWRVE